MSRNEMVDAKADEIRQQLGRWAHEAGILEGGEVLIFSLRIGRILPVHREELEDGNLPKPNGLKGGKKYLEPANLTDAQVQELLGLAPRGSFDLVRALVQNNNKPTVGYSSPNKRPHIADDHELNRRLLHKGLGGRYYRLVHQLIDYDDPRGVSLHYHSHYQLWEISL